MHDEVSETENIRKNLSIERLFADGCDLLLDSNQVFIRQGKNTIYYLLFISAVKEIAIPNVLKPS